MDAHDQEQPMGDRYWWRFHWRSASWRFNHTSTRWCWLKQNVRPCWYRNDSMKFLFLKFQLTLYHTSRATLLSVAQKMSWTKSWGPSHPPMSPITRTPSQHFLAWIPILWLFRLVERWSQVLLTAVTKRSLFDTIRRFLSIHEISLASSSPTMLKRV